MAKPSQIILLVEDKRHEQFTRRYLRRLNYGAHTMRFVTSPTGAGSAEGWVREQFPIQVEACRRRQAETKLIVLIDADALTVQQRRAQLDQTLRQAGLLPIPNDSRDRAPRSKAQYRDVDSLPQQRAGGRNPGLQANSRRLDRTHPHSRECALRVDPAKCNSAAVMRRVATDRN